MKNEKGEDESERHEASVRLEEEEEQAEENTLGFLLSSIALLFFFACPWNQ